MTRYGFVEATPGTCERGAAEYQRQRDMIEAAGSVYEYMRGCVWRGDRCNNSRLTAGVGRGIIQEAEGHDKAPDSAA